MSEVETIILGAVANAYGALRFEECPDCEGPFNPSEDEACQNCGLTVDDLCARLERRVRS